MPRGLRHRQGSLPRSRQVAARLAYIRGTMQQDPWYPPPPGPPRPPPRRPLLRVFVVIGIAVAVFAAGIVAFVLPIPLFYVYQPGPVRDAEDLVVVRKQRTYASEGDLYLTTVSVDVEATAYKLLQAAMDPEKAVVYAQDFTRGKSIRQLNREQRLAMRTSKRRAEEVALAALDYGHPTGDGARVEQTDPRSPAHDVLEQGDIILSVDGKPVETTCDVGRAIDNTVIGDRVELEIRRAGKVRSVRLSTARSPLDPEGAYIGVFMTDIDYRFKTGLRFRRS